MPKGQDHELDMRKPRKLVLLRETLHLLEWKSVGGTEVVEEVITSNALKLFCGSGRTPADPCG